MSAIAKLDAAIKAVCPIDGISIGKPNDKTTWLIQFRPEATAPQRAAAQSVVDAFVWDDSPIDFSDVDNVEKSLKALGLVVATWNGKTPAQLKTAFKAAWDSLP